MRIKGEKSRKKACPGKLAKDVPLSGCGSEAGEKHTHVRTGAESLKLANRIIKYGKTYLTTSNAIGTAYIESQL